MKRYFCFMVAVIVVSAFTGCKDKKNTGDIITKKPMIVVHRQIQKTGNYKQSRKVKWLGAAYTVEMTRSADASLPVIVDGDTKY